MKSTYTKLLLSSLLIFLIVFSLPIIVICNDCDEVELIRIPRFKLKDLGHGPNPEQPIKAELIYKDGICQKKISSTWFGRFKYKFYLIGRDKRFTNAKLVFTNLGKVKADKFKLYSDKEDIVNLTKIVKEYNLLSGVLWFGINIDLEDTEPVIHEISYDKCYTPNCIFRELDNIEYPSEYNLVLFEEYETIHRKAEAQTSYLGNIMMTSHHDLNAIILLHETTHMFGLEHGDKSYSNNDSCNVVSWYQANCRLTSHREALVEMVARKEVRELVESRRLTKGGCLCAQSNIHLPLLAYVHLDISKLADIYDEDILREMEYVVNDNLDSNYLGQLRRIYKKEFIELGILNLNYWDEASYIEYRIRSLKQIRSRNLRAVVGHKLKHFDVKQRDLSNNVKLKQLVKTHFSSDEIPVISEKPDTTLILSDPEIIQQALELVKPEEAIIIKPNKRVDFEKLNLTAVEKAKLIKAAFDAEDKRDKKLLNRNRN